MSSVAQENQRICLELKLPGNLQSGIGVNKPRQSDTVPYPTLQGLSDLLEKVRISGVGKLIVNKQLNTVLNRSGLSANLNLFPKNLGGS